jgi:hypothetical protein
MGIIATLAMEVFLRVTDMIFRHNVNFAWLNGTSLGFDPQAFTTLLAGYVVFLFGGIVWAYLYQRFVPKKNTLTGIIYAVVVPLIIVAGLIMMPLMGFTHPLVQAGVIPNPGLFALGFGPTAGLFNLLGHVVYGAVLGAMSSRIQN